MEIGNWGMNRKDAYVMPDTEELMECWVVLQCLQYVIVKNPYVYERDPLK